MATKSIKIQINFSNDNTINKSSFNKLFNDLKYGVWKASNRAITYLYSNDMQNLIQKDVGLPKQEDKDIFGKSFGAWIENRMNEIALISNSGNMAQQRAFVVNRYKQDKKNGLLKGDVTLTSFKRDLPIIIHNKSYKIIDSSGFNIEIGLFNKSIQKEYGIKRILFSLPKLNSNTKQILRRIESGEYKQGTAQLKYDSKKKKYFLTISFSFEINKIKELDDNLTMGVDLGITNVATISIFDINKEEYLNLKWSERVLDGSDLNRARTRIEQLRRELYRATKYFSNGAVGHGYKRRCKKPMEIGDKISRIKDTFNHKISKYIVDLAFKYNVKTIQLEDLSGFSEAQENIFLKSWSYFDLQSKIKYKALEKGIEVVMINPKYTSKRCNRCGSIHKDNRDCKSDQAKFKCVVCGHEDNADINASKNIAIPYIDKIIESDLKEVS